MLSMDPTIWPSRVTLNMSLLQVLTVHGYLLLALRHPEVGALGPSRDIAEETVAILSRILVHTGAIDAADLRRVYIEEAAPGGMTWAAYEAACARIDARVAAMGVANPDDEGGGV